MLSFFNKKENKFFVTNWKDLIKTYEEESEGTVKQMPLSFAALYPTNFEKQKASPALNNFHGKTKDVLVQQNMKGTARILELVLHMKSLKLNIILNDKNIKPLFDPSYERSTFLQDMAIMFKQIDMYSLSTKVRKLTLTADKSDLLHVTLNGISYLIPKILTKMKYVSEW